MLLDRYVNELPQADVAREELGSSEVAEIESLITAGVKTNILIQVDDVQMIDTTLTNAAAIAAAEAAAAETEMTPDEEDSGMDPDAVPENEEPSDPDSETVETEGE
jgi:hypothetical protein